MTPAAPPSSVTHTPAGASARLREWVLDWTIPMALLLGAAYLAHVRWAKGRGIAEIFLLDQDFPVLWGTLLAIVLLAFWTTRGSTFAPRPPSMRIAGGAMLIILLMAWAGRTIVFQDYSLSRDEEMAEFAAAYMRAGHLAWPIPPEWVDYRRALVPEFFSPFGATQYWAATYLPVNSAIRALFDGLGDPDLAAPVLLALGLAALWHNARLLFPDRPDAQWVTLLLAFTSAQLLVTAMTPYAMTGHFAFNMLWLAGILRGGWRGHGAAAIVAVLAGGLHQWHFVLLFIVGFLFWFALRRRWAAMAFHALVCVVIVALWAKLWPALLIDLYGPASDIRPSAGVADKISSLFGRVFRSWYPLAYSVRFIAWNNLLLIPLAVLAVLSAGWRGLFRGDTPVLPLALGCAAGAALMTAQVYGWGFRYMHGYIGSFCLLGGYGWIALSRQGRLPLRLLATACVLACCSTAFLAWRAHLWVAPYAAADRLIRSSPTDLVIVDPRGGVYATDLARSQHGRFVRPLVLSLGMLDTASIDRLCAGYSVALFDRTAFLPLGIPPARVQAGALATLRAHMDSIGCGMPLRQSVPNR